MDLLNSKRKHDIPCKCKETEQNPLISLAIAASMMPSNQHDIPLHIKQVTEEIIPLNRSSRIKAFKEICNVIAPDIKLLKNKENLSSGELITPQESANLNNSSDIRKICSPFLLNNNENEENSFAPFSVIKNDSNNFHSNANNSICKSTIELKNQNVNLESGLQMNFTNVDQNNRNDCAQPNSQIIDKNLLRSEMLKILPELLRELTTSGISSKNEFQINLANKKQTVSIDPTLISYYTDKTLNVDRERCQSSITSQDVNQSSFCQLKMLDGPKEINISSRNITSSSNLIETSIQSIANSLIKNQSLNTHTDTQIIPNYKGDVKYKNCITSTSTAKLNVPFQTSATPFSINKNIQYYPQESTAQLKTSMVISQPNNGSSSIVSTRLNTILPTSPVKCKLINQFQSCDRSKQATASLSTSFENEDVLKKEPGIRVSSFRTFSNLTPKEIIDEQIIDGKSYYQILWTGTTWDEKTELLSNSKTKELLAQYLEVKRHSNKETLKQNPFIITSQVSVEKSTDNHSSIYSIENHTDLHHTESSLILNKSNICSTLINSLENSSCTESSEIPSLQRDCYVDNQQLISFKNKKINRESDIIKHVKYKRKLDMNKKKSNNLDVLQRPPFPRSQTLQKKTFDNHQAIPLTQINQSIVSVTQTVIQNTNTIISPQNSRNYVLVRAVLLNKLFKRNNLHAAQKCFQQDSKESNFGTNHVTNLSTDLEDIKTKIQCKHCSVFYNSQQYALHVSLKRSCQICSLRICSKKKLMDHIINHEMKNHIYSRCFKTFQTKKDYMFHVQSHTNKLKQELKCNKCKKIFRGFFSLGRHNQKCSSNFDLIYKCNVCRKQFSSEFTLKKHTTLHKEAICGKKLLISCPEERKINSCNPKTLTKKGHLKASIFMHRFVSKSMFRKSVCITCIIGFKNPESFYKHINRNDCVMIKNSSQCVCCKQTFNSLDVLRAHVITCFKDSLASLLKPFNKTTNKIENLTQNFRHTVYHCSKCNKFLSSSHISRTHNKVFHLKREFFCSRCNYKFYNRCLMSKHIEAKECVQLFQCFICNESDIPSPEFSSQSLLIDHLKTHKKEDKLHDNLHDNNLKSLKPATIKDSIGQTITITLNSKDIKKLSSETLGLCDIPGFGKYVLKIVESELEMKLIVERFLEVGTSNNQQNEVFTLTEQPKEISNLTNQPKEVSALTNQPIEVSALTNQPKDSLKCFSCLSQHQSHLILEHFKSIHNWNTNCFYVCKNCNLVFQNENGLNNHNIEPGKCILDQNQNLTLKQKYIEKENIKNLASTEQCKNFAATEQCQNSTSTEQYPVIIVCHHCDLPFFNENRFYNHKCNVTETDRISKLVQIDWACLICKKKIDQSIQAHCATHSAAIFECFFCNLKFLSKFKLVKHFKEQHKKTWGPKMEHWVTEIQNDADEVVLDKIYHKKLLPTDKPESDFKCQSCLVVFFHAETLKNHMLHVCKDKSIIKWKGASWVKNEKKCPECHKNFNNESSFLHHCLKSHGVVFKLKCSICSKLCMNTKEMLKHISNDHNLTDVLWVSDYSEKVETVAYFRGTNCCTCCLAIFNDKLSLLRHMFIHTEIKTEVCNACGEFFVTLEELKVHVYTSHKCFFCECCRRMLHTFDDLHLHSQLHVLEFNIPRDENGKMIVEVQDDTRSDAVQKLFPEETIEQPLFSITSKVKRNILEDDRLFNCYVCHKNVEGELTFIVHIKMHPLPRILFCLLCKANYDNTRDLETHLKSHFDKNMNFSDDFININNSVEEDDYFKCKICYEVFGTEEELVNHTSSKKLNDIKMKLFKKAINTSSITKRYCDTKSNEKERGKSDFFPYIDWELADLYDLRKIFYWKFAKVSPTCENLSVDLKKSKQCREKNSFLCKALPITNSIGLTSNSLDTRANINFDKTVTEVKNNTIIKVDNDKVLQKNANDEKRILSSNNKSSENMPNELSNQKRENILMNDNRIENLTISNLDASKKSIVNLAKETHKSKQVNKPKRFANKVSHRGMCSDVKKSRKVLGIKQGDGQKDLSTKTNKKQLCTDGEPELCIGQSALENKRERNLRVVLILADGSGNTCKFCSWKFPSFEELKSHLLKHIDHPSGILIDYQSRDVCCALCSCLVRKTSLMMHLKLKHSRVVDQYGQFKCKTPKIDLDSKNNKVTQVNKDLLNSGKKDAEIIDTLLKNKSKIFFNQPIVMPYPYTCAVCNRGYFQLSSYLSHYRTSHPWLYENELNKYPKVNRKKLSKAEISIIENDVLQCVKNTETVSEAKNKKESPHIESDQPPLKNLLDIKSDSLILSISNEESGTIIPCKSDSDGDIEEVTDEEIVESSSDDDNNNLSSLTILSQKKEIKCTLCNLNFLSELELSRHTKTHKSCTAVCSYMCLFCGFATNETLVLKKHLITKHKNLYTKDLELSSSFINRNFTSEGPKALEQIPKTLETVPKTLEQIPKTLEQLASSKIEVIENNKSLVFSENDEKRSSRRKRSINPDVESFLKGCKKRRTTPENNNISQLMKTIRDVKLPILSDRIIPLHNDDSKNGKTKKTNLHLQIARCNSDERKEEEFPCRWCGVLLNSQPQLDLHKKNHRKGFSKNKEYFNKLRCCVCNCLIPRYDLKWHMHVTHDEDSNITLENKRRFCKLCKYSTRHSLDEHTAKEHPQSLRVECKLCDQRFPTTTLYEKHFQKIHGNSIDEKALICYLCNKTFETLVSLHNHYSVTHMEKKSDLCCKTCNKYFYTQLDLIKHQSEFHNCDKFECGLCMLEFNDVELCESHVIFHKKFTDFKCSICNFYFESSDVLKKHILNSHESVSIDNETSREIKSLTTEMFLTKMQVNTEDAEKSEVIENIINRCVKCDETFIRKEIFLAHMKKFHSI